MKHIENHFEGLYETQIYYQGWLPEEDPKAVLIIVHGIAEHSGRYVNVVEALKSEGIAIYGLDHRGHGKSAGKFNHVKRFTDYVADLGKLQELLISEYPDLPMFILGHSMGSIITNTFMAQNPEQSRYKSMILSGTGADVGPGINGLTIFLAKVLSAIMPGLSIPSNLDPSFISRDETEVQKYVDDPLVHYEKVTTRLGAELLKYTTRMIDSAEKIKIPTLLQIGSEDEAFAPESRKPLFEAFSNDKKEMKVYDGYRHEVYNEIDKEVVLNDLKTWINGFI